MNFAELSAQRYALRKFSDRPVEDALLQQVLEAGRNAPTAHNNQPQRIFVLQSPEAMAKADACMGCHFHPPVLLAVAYDPAAAWDRECDGKNHGEIDATITNALSKEAINMAGHHYSGHTEIYADYTHTSKYTMMLAHEDLRVVHVSTHVALREACDRVKKDRVLDVIRIANEGCKAIGIKEPKLAVAGLNPHCGENGMFGTEEIEEIQPAIDIALAEGINIVEKKPTPPDTVFSKALGGWYDIVVVMYHDQGHIPLKVEGFVYNKAEGHWDAVAGVNVTLGLPIIRSSVDHGTGFGHAGDGHANELSLVNAMDYGIRMANTKAEN